MNLSPQVLLINVADTIPMPGGETLLPLSHLGLIALKLYVEEVDGYTVDLLDADQSYVSSTDIAKLANARDRLVVGFSTTQETMEEVLSIAAEIKNRQPKTYIVLGGHQASFTAKEILDHEKQIDGVILGEGETPFLQLIRRQIVGTKISIESLVERNELIFSSKGKRNETLNLDALPNVGQFQLRQNSEVAISTTRGCYGRCTFCSTPNFYQFIGGERWRSRSVQSIVSEIILLVERGATSIHIHDPDFLGMGKYAIERATKIASKLKERRVKIPIRFTCQAVAASRCSLDFWQLWREVGLEKVYIGFEAGSDEKLKLFGKSSKSNDGLVAYRLLKEAGIVVQAGFIMFEPFTDVQMLKRNLEFLDAVDQGHVYKHYASALRAYPGTGIFESLAEQNLLEFEKVYLPTKVLYKDQQIGLLARTLALHMGEQMAADRFIIDIDFGIAGSRSEVRYGDVAIEVDEKFKDIYRQFKHLRSQTISAKFTEMLEARDGKCVAAQVSSLNKGLLQQFEKFRRSVRGM